MSGILICDDQPIIHDSLGIYLTDAGMSFFSAYDGNEALELFARKNPDLVLLDVMMPGRDGIEVCREIRKSSRTPIIILSAKGEELDRILGLELGADDYIVKPFSLREVVVRIKTILRRVRIPDEDKDTALHFPGMDIDGGRYEVRIADAAIPFTPKEIAVLHFLASNPGFVFGRERILNEVWGYDYYGDTRVVDTIVKRIRQKLCACSHTIKSVYGVGYKFERENENG
ncbi:MAG: response regulator transcription factor [Clostridiales Family XIII bacterium]|nr:response regulator transcription factor [Clostridiales Family XIII bacterium]